MRVSVKNYTVEVERLIKKFGSQEQLAKASGVSASTISRIRRGMFSPRAHSWEQLVSARKTITR